MASALEIIKQFVEKPENQFKIPKGRSLEDAITKRDIRTTCEDWFTPLILAAKQGNLDVVKAYIELGIGNEHETDLSKKTAFMHALENKHTEIAKALCDAELVNFQAIDKQDKTTLMYAVRSDDMESLDAVLRKTHWLNDQNEHNQTALMLAVAAGKEEAVGKLLDKKGIDINAQKIWGRYNQPIGQTALDVAYDCRTSNTGANYSKIVIMLVEAGAKTSDGLSITRKASSTNISNKVVYKGPLYLQEQFEREEKQDPKKSGKCTVM